MPFVDHTAQPRREIAPGFHARFVHAERMTLALVEIDAGATLPEHAHPHEQATSVLEGELELTVGGEARTLTPGMVAVIPPNVRHSARARVRCRVMDVFQPVREDYR